MRNLKKSFLFFLLICFFCNSNVRLQAQQDSSYYYYQSIINPKKNSDLISALIFYSNHKNENLANNNVLGAIQDLRLIAIAQNKIGSFNESENSAIEALQLLDKLKVRDSIARDARIGLLNHLGRIYDEHQLYQKALDYYDKVLNIGLNKKNLTSVLNNKALVFLKMKNYDQAVIEFNKVYKNSLTFNDKKRIARALDNLGFAQSKLNHPEGIINIKKALELRKELNYVPGIFTSYLHLAEYYKDRKSNLEALSFAKKALSIAEENGNSRYEIEALSLLLNLTDNEYVKRYKTKKDSIELTQKTEENKFASLRYDLSKSEKEAATNKIESEKQKRINLLYKFGGLSLITLFLTIFLLVRAKHKREKLQQVFKTEAKISKRIHDEFANDIYVTMNKVQDKASPDDVLDKLDIIYNKARNISNELNLDFAEKDFTIAISDLLFQFSTEDVSVLTKGISKVDLNSFSTPTKNILYRVLQELMINMQKHSKASTVVITFEQELGKTKISYSDNGIGCLIEKKNGLANVENRIKSVGGKITFDSQQQNGFRASITI